MYKITFLHKDETEERDLYIPGDDNYCLLSARLDVACGTSGELVLEIPDINPAKTQIDCLTDEIVVYRFNDESSSEIWRGRPVTIQVDFDLTGTLTCEGILSYLYDTYYEPFEFAGPPKELLQDIIDNHNSKVEERKQFTLGEITVEDPNDYISRSSIYYNRTLTVLQEKFIEDSLGGYFRVRVDGDTRYLDYLKAYNTESGQPVEYGYNLLDIAQNVEYGDVATAILPLGTRLEDEDGNQTDDRLTIASVNGGDIYLQDPQAVATYGWIAVEVEWDDVTLPENLYDKAYEYLIQVTSPVSRFTIQAVDLSLADPTLDPISLGDYVLIRVDSHGVNQYVELTAMDIDLLDPVNSILEFGTDAATLTGATSSSSRTIQESLGDLSLRVTNLTANVINAVYANIEEIVASTITTDFIRAAVADLGYVTAEWVEANYAAIEYVDANFASIIDLQVATENVELLNADVANIISLLAGEAGVGALEAIHLTTDNAVIEEAVITEALINTVLAGIIQSNIIYTDQITIMSENGGIYLAGTTMQFCDENGTVRLQLGQDASGNFTFVLYDESGTGVMIDSEGIHASAVPDGLIINDMVADDANISASKLDIADLTETLNENGQLVLTAEQITIGGGTLDYTLTDIYQQIADLETLQGIQYVENWYALSTNPEYYPPLDAEEDGKSAVLGVGILGRMVLGTSTKNWTTERLVAHDGQYLWFAQKIYYSDGTTAWTTPTLITDDYIRTTTSTLQTEFEVVQGQIEAKIWQTDIDSAVNSLNDEISTIRDQYAVVLVNLEEVELGLGTLETIVDEQYTELNSQIINLLLDYDGITAEVRDISDKTANAITEGVPYYAVSTNPNYYPPHDATDKTAVLGKGILGRMVLGVSENNWTTKQPEAQEGKYIWISYLRTRVDGSTYWTTPTLITDEYARLAQEEMSERYSELVLTIDEALLEVANVRAELGSNYSTTTEVKALIDESVTETSATILQEVSYSYVTQSDLEENYYDSSTTDAMIKLYADEALSSITLSVDDGVLGSQAVIKMTAGGNEETAEIDLSEVRYAFANDDSEVLIAAGLITFASDTIVIDSDYFKVTAEGEITATKGNIGGWTIGDKSLYNNCDSMTSTTNGMYIGTDGIRNYSSGDYLNITSASIINGNSSGNYSLLKSGALSFYRDDAFVGQFQTNSWSGVSGSKGIALNLEYDCDYITFGRKPSPSSSNFTSYLTISFNEEIYDYRFYFSGTSCFYGAMRISTGGLRVSGDIYTSSELQAATINVHDYGTLSYFNSSIATGISLDHSMRIYENAYVGSSFYAGGYTVTVAGAAYASGGWSDGSDENLKNDIIPLATGTETFIDKLNPVSYSFKDDEKKKTHFGVTYQNVCEALEAEGIDPEESGMVGKVTDEDGNETGTLCYDELIAPLIYEVQTLKAEIKALKKQIA